MFVQLEVASGSREGQVIPVTVKKFIIGRAADCHLKSKSELISRYHCAILVGDEVIVRDLGSKNGVRLNGERIISEQKLKQGDYLVIGPLEFFVRIAEDSASTGTSGQYDSGIGDSSDVGTSEPTVTLLPNMGVLTDES